MANSVHIRCGFILTPRVGYSMAWVLTLKERQGNLKINMPYRTTIFVDDHVYHLVNRGVARSPIFKDVKDYQRALELMGFYKYAKPGLRFSHYNRLPLRGRSDFLESLKKDNKPLVEILAFCLMPNHTHFLLRQRQDKGVPTFMKNLGDSYARYFNTKYDRIGGLFQAMFRAVMIESDEQLLHVSRYIHLNPASSCLIKPVDLPKFPWSSLGEYLGNRPAFLTNSNPILGLLAGKEAYRQFVFDQADYQKELEKIKHLVLEK